MHVVVPESQQRRTPMPVPESHFVNGTKLKPQFPAGLETAAFGMGCFWGAEKRFWELEGVYTTAVGYAGGSLVHPTYREVCGGNTGHAEVVLVVYDPVVISYEEFSAHSGKDTIPRKAFDRATISVRNIARSSSLQLTHSSGKPKRRAYAMKSNFRWPAMIGLRRRSNSHHLSTTRKRSISSILPSTKADSVHFVPTSADREWQDWIRTCR